MDPLDRDHLAEIVDALFRAWTTDRLKVMRAALVCDRDHGGDRDFCTGRIAVIDAILQEREAS